MRKKAQVQLVICCLDAALLFRCVCVISFLCFCTAAYVCVPCVFFFPSLSSQIYQQDGRKDTHSRELAASSSELECVAREKEKKKDTEDRKRLIDSGREGGG